MKKVFILIAIATLVMTSCDNKTQKTGSANDSLAVESIEDTLAVEEADTAKTVTITAENFDIKDYLPAMRVQAADVYDCKPGDIFFDSYALVDVDHDGLPEVIVKSGEQSYKVLFSLADGEPLLLAHSWGATDLYFFEHGVAAQGGCGIGCMMSDCTLMKDSRPVTTFKSFEESDMEGEVVATTNTQEGKEITSEEFDKLYKQLGEQVDIEFEMKEIDLEEPAERSKLHDYAE